jgi:hypothetical protein
MSTFMPKILRLRISASAAVAAVVLSVSAVGPVSAATGSTPPPGGGGASTSDGYVASVGVTVVKNQEMLMKFKTWVMDQPGIVSSGYLDQINDASTLSTNILWHGNSPLRAEVLAEATREGITASISERPQSMPQIKAITSKLWASKEKLADAGFQIAGIVGLQLNSPNITVEGTYTTAEGAAAPNVKTLLETTAGTAVDVRGGVKTKATAAVRSNDWAPFNAGGYMYSVGHVCSSGFALSIGGGNWTTTARHCGETPWYDRDNSGISYGFTRYVSSDGAARVLTATGSPFTFDGAWNNSYGYYKTVSAYADVSLGDHVCTSGGNSGVHCNILITSMYYSFDDGWGPVVSTIRGDQQTAGQIAVIQGDSGGPVFVPYSDGSHVGASGMIQGEVNGDPYNCGPVHDQGNNFCSPTVLFTSIRTIANALGGSLVTG